MKKPRGGIPRTRNRYMREAYDAWHKDRLCYVILRITGGPSHGEIQEDWQDCRLDCRTSMPVEFEIANLGRSHFRSGRSSCVKKEDALIINRALRRPLTTPTRTSAEESRFWHFSGGIRLPDEEMSLKMRPALCEYNAKSRRGFVLTAFCGQLIPQFWQQYPQLLQEIRVFKTGEYAWLCREW